MAKRKVSEVIFGQSISSLILSNIGYLAFLGVLALVYIGNAHYAEYNVRRIQLLERQIKEQRWIYMSLQSENMHSGLRSEVMSKVKGDGLRLHRGKPKKVIVTLEELEPLKLPTR